jgi:ribosomal protein S18 acetylase RimI-like enzyme
VVSASLPSNYRVRLGSPLDRALLLQFARRAYREVEPEHSGEMLPKTIDRYLSPTTPVWWIETTSETDSSNASNLASAGLSHLRSSYMAIACLWLGTATTPTDGELRAYVLLIYVAPDHRRRGLASYLLDQAEAWAKQRGDRQIGLQVMAQNTAAIALYHKRGYTTISQWMSKPID